MTIDDFIRCMKLTPDNAEEEVSRKRKEWFGAYGGSKMDYECRPSGVTLNGMPRNEDEEISMTWDDVLEYVLYQQVRLW